MKKMPNVIIYYVNKDLHTFETELSLNSCQNIGIEIYFEVDKHSKALQKCGFRHSIMFVDFTSHKCISMPHMWPLDIYPIMPLSKEDEQRIITQYNL